MKCELKEVGKYFNDHCIFSGISLTLESENNYVILGSNGSGKSTLIKIIAGGVSPTEGSLLYTLNGAELKPEHLAKNIAFCSPYMELIEEFTFMELINFQEKFKPFINGLKPKDIIKLSGLQRIQNKVIRNFSSGMKQRVKLCLSILSNAPIILLDEPTSNLDPNGKVWYKSLLAKYANNKTVVVASNFLEEEYPENPTLIELANFKGVIHKA